MSDESDSLATKFREDLESGLIHGNDISRSFIPVTTIDRCWADDVDTIRSKLGLQDWENKELLHILSHSCRLVASILIWIGYKDYRRKLHEKCQLLLREREVGQPATFGDAMLPFSIDTCEKFLGLPAGRTFYHDQFIFIPIIISCADHGVREVDPQQKWPFRERLKDIGLGAYGRVSLARIVKRQFKDSKDSSNDSIKNVACKKVERSADWRKEVKTLDFLKESLSAHQRLLLHYAAFIQGTEFYIFLPYTELGDLETFFKEGTWQDENSATQIIPDYASKFGHYKVLDVVKEFAHIIDATDFLHNKVSSIRGIPVFCAHCDLRPQNILIFPGGKENPAGRWHICDFGISSIQLEGGKRVPDPKWSKYPSMGDICEGRWMPQGTTSEPRKFVGMHRAPEMSMCGIFEPRQSDVWSLGSILVEIFAFGQGLESGSSPRASLEQFRHRRRKHQSSGFNDYFYDIEQPMINVPVDFDVLVIRRDEVDEFLLELCSTGSSTYNRLVPIVDRMLQADPFTRCSAAEAFSGISSVCTLEDQVSPSHNSTGDVPLQSPKYVLSSSSWAFKAKLSTGDPRTDGCLVFLPSQTGHDAENDQSSPNEPFIPISPLLTAAMNTQETPASSTSLSSHLEPIHEIRASNHHIREADRTLWPLPASKVQIARTTGTAVGLVKQNRQYPGHNIFRSKRDHRRFRLVLDSLREAPGKHDNGTTKDLPQGSRWENLHIDGHIVIITGRDSLSRRLLTTYLYDLDRQQEIQLPNEMTMSRMCHFRASSGNAIVAFDDQAFTIWHVGGNAYPEMNLSPPLGSFGQVAFSHDGRYLFTWSCKSSGDIVIIWKIGPTTKPEIYGRYRVPRESGRPPSNMLLVPCGVKPACLLYLGNGRWVSIPNEPTNDEGRGRLGSTKMQDNLVDQIPQSADLCMATENHLFILSTANEIMYFGLRWDSHSLASIAGPPRQLHKVSLKNLKAMTTQSKQDGNHKIIICDLRGGVESLDIAW